MEQRLIDTNKTLYDCDLEYGCDKICYCDNCPHRIMIERKKMIEIKEGE